MSVASPSIADAYRHCEALTREQAGNFFYGIRLLPGPKRRAMCAVYAFARLIDDIGDGDESADRKLELLADARAGLEVDSRMTRAPRDQARPDAERAASASSPMRIALADAERRFALPRDALTDLIDGVEMDVRGTEYETFDELVIYCRRVAGSVGRLCLAIFGSSDMASADPLADDLGVAMQLTNILRDVREDLDRGRIYLPAEDRRRFGCEDLESAAPSQFASLMTFEGGRARSWFDRGLALVELIDARSASCVCAMTGIYRRILDRIDQSPESVLDHRLSLAAWEKTWVALRSLAGAAR
jgi:phytoene synthase